MNLFLTLLADGTIFAWIAGAAAFVGAIVSITIKVYRAVEKYRKLRNGDEERKEKIESNAMALASMQKAFQELELKLDGVVDKIDTLNKRIKEREENTNKERRIARKVQIKDIYSKCNENKEIDAKELECLLELIESYETAGGTNSFVHEIVIPQMKEWKVVHEEGDSYEGTS